jgi:hypothetical protein
MAFLFRDESFKYVRILEYELTTVSSKNLCICQSFMLEYSLVVFQLFL